MKVKPIKNSVKALAHTSPYKVHKYYARRPHNVFRNLIKHYSKEGEIVLDVFCGGGVTVYEGLATNRKVIGVDLNPLATFITEMQVQQISPTEFKEFAMSTLRNLKQEFEWVYDVKNEEHVTLGSLVWSEWAYNVECPYCQNTITLSEENKVKNGYYRCSNPTCKSNMEDNYQIKRTDCKPVGSLPIRVKLKDGKVHRFSAQESELIVRSLAGLEERILDDSMVKVDQAIPENWDRTNEDKLFEKGVRNFKDFFTARNYAINTVIFNRIVSMKNNHSIPKTILDLLYFSFSASLRHTNNMTRVTSNWENGNPTSMDKHAYWLPNQYVETNIFIQWEKKINALVKSLEHTEKTIAHPTNKVKSYEELLKTDGSYMVLTQSSSDLPIPDSSIDVVITDPPYGSNVQYNELSSFWNIWYESYSGNEVSLIQAEEAVMNRKKNIEGSKTVDHYEEMLYKIFEESYRVLKDKSYLVFTFNNKNMNVWFALLRAAARAGFELPNDGVLFQDYIESYKNTSHLRFEGNIQGDFIYSFQKDEFRKTRDSTVSIDNFEMTLKNEILSIIDTLFNESKKYKTTDLYQAIFGGVVHVMMEIARQTLVDDEELTQVEKKSDSYIDQVLNSVLTYDGEYWRKKEEQMICIK